MPPVEPDESKVCRGTFLSREQYLIDLDYCKGCGICEVVCPVRNAVHMEEVRA